jgi:hypothetical protein
MWATLCDNETQSASSRAQRRGCAHFTLASPTFHLGKALETGETIAPKCL